MKFELSSPLLPWSLLALSLLILLWALRHKKQEKPGLKGDLWGSEVVMTLRAQLKKQQEMYRDQVEFFVNFPEVIKTLAGAVTIEEVTSSMSRAITALLGSTRIGIFLAHADKTLRLADGAGFGREYRGTYTCPLRTPELLPILKYRSISEMKGHEAACRFLAPLNLSPTLAVPMWYGERLLGLLVISQPTNDIQTARRIFAMLADLMSVSLHAAGMVAEIRKKAERDALTGLPNRRTLMDRVTVEIERCSAYNSKFTLAMIDVDNFKHYNDNNGHAAGDEALKKVASLLASGLRRTDFAARYGGEEFTLLLQNSAHEDARRTADRVRRMVAEADFPFREKQPMGMVSISVGLATYPDDAKDVTALFKAADNALYQAKEGGRNRVVVHESGIDID